MVGYKKCKECLANYPKDYIHSCDGLMKELVLNKKKHKEHKVASMPACAIFDMMMPGCGPRMMYSEAYPGSHIEDYEKVKDEWIKKYNNLVKKSSPKFDK